MRGCIMFFGGLICWSRKQGDHTKDWEYEDSCDIKAKMLIKPIEKRTKTAKILSRTV